jgi:hypothetical protein
MRYWDDWLSHGLERASHLFGNGGWLAIEVRLKRPLVGFSGIIILSLEIVLYHELI